MPDTLPKLRVAVLNCYSFFILERGAALTRFYLCVNEVKIGADGKTGDEDFPESVAAEWIRPYKDGRNK